MLPVGFHPRRFNDYEHNNAGRNNIQRNDTLNNTLHYNIKYDDI